MSLAVESERLTSFGNEPWWLIVIKVVAVFVLLVVVTLLTIWAERRIVGRMQQRLGPNRVGPFGTLQGLADGIKLAFKEDIIPALADRPVYLIAPVLSVVPAFLAFAVVPFGPDVTVNGLTFPLQLTDLPVGVLYILACSSIGVYGIVLGGWASGSTYPLLGGLRSAAQVISYEVAMGLSFVAVFLFAGSVSTSEIVSAQTTVWYAIPLIPSFAIYCIAMVGETNRAPFDLPEAESELVGGFHTEYSSLKFALFFLAEYINMVTVSALAATLFLGGWMPIWPLSEVDAFWRGFWPMLWFLSKVAVFLFVFIWLRGTLPRMRYDQFMKFGWQRLIPLSLLWILVVATFQVFRNEGVSRQQLLLYVLVPALILMAVVYAVTGRERPEAQESQPTRDDLVGPGEFPVPPLPGERPLAGTQVTQRTEEVRPGARQP